MLNLTELQSMRDALQRAMFLGARRVQYASSVVDYNSPQEQQIALGNLDAEIAKRSATAPSTFTLAVHSRE